VELRGGTRHFLYPSQVVFTVGGRVVQDHTTRSPWLCRQPVPPTGSGGDHSRHQHRLSRYPSPSARSQQDVLVEPEEVRGVVAALGPREPLPGFPRIGRPEPRLALVTDKVDVRALVAALVTTELCGSRTRPNLVLRPHLREALDRDEAARAPGPRGRRDADARLRAGRLRQDDAAGRVVERPLRRREVRRPSLVERSDAFPALPNGCAEKRAR
jgi:hypothetical protein